MGIQVNKPAIQRIRQESYWKKRNSRITCVKKSKEDEIHSGTTYVDTVGGQVPAGYIGVYAKLYTSGGSLKETAGWAYTNEASNGLILNCPI